MAAEIIKDTTPLTTGAAMLVPLAYPYFILLALGRVPLPFIVEMISNKLR